MEAFQRFLSLCLSPVKRKKKKASSVCVCVGIGGLFVCLGLCCVSRERASIHTLLLKEPKNKLRSKKPDPNKQQ